MRTALAEEFQALQPLFAALGNETRQRIFLVLLESERVGLRAGELTKRTHLSRPVVSHHLRVLRETGAVGVFRKGTRIYYYPKADSDCWNALRVLADNICAVTASAAQEGCPNLEEEDSWN